MTIVRSRTFRCGGDELILLPPSVAFGQNVEVVIVRAGDVMTVYPAKKSIAEMIVRLRALPAPPTIETRDIDTWTD